MASAVAAIELVVLLVVGVALIAKPVAAQVRKAAEQRAMASLAAPPPKPKQPRIGAAKLARGDTAVLVLNGNGRTGAAAAEAERVRAKGYRIASVGDAPRRDYTRTLVMYRPGFAAEGHRLARDLRVKIVGPLDGLGVRAIEGAHVVIVLGSD